MAGIGTWQYNDSVAGKAVLAALGLGYNHIDTAVGYNNQVGIGKAIIASKRDRKSFFLTSKIPGGLNYTAATAQLNLALTQLQVDYVDLMLVHFPATWGGKGGKEMRIQEWKALEDFHKAGKAKAIGVSHYCQRHLEDILAIATVPPMINQVQFHVGMGNAGPNATDGRAFMKSKNIVFQSFSPLCGPCGTTELLNGTLVTGIGKKYGKSGAQVSLRWQVQQGIPVIPKTDNVNYMAENIDLFDWALSEEDMKTLTDTTSPAVAGDAGPPATSGDCTVE
jgi:diketogulonate reductase-like aldo/keto reductase